MLFGMRRHLSALAVLVSLAASANWVDAGDDCAPDWVPYLGQCTIGFGQTNSPNQTTPLAMAEFDDGTGNGKRLYVAGLFNSIAGQPAQGVAVWNGSAWQTLPGTTGGTITSLLVHDDGTGNALYACGSFSTIGGVATGRVARWNGRQWSAVGSAVSGGVKCMVVHNDGTGAALYIGGSLLAAGGMQDASVAKWNGEEWTAVGDAFPFATVNALAVHDDGAGPLLYAGCGSDIVPGPISTAVARWTGLVWQPVGDNMAGPIGCMISFDDGTGAPAQLIVGGTFLYSGPGGYLQVARWNGDSWNPLGGGLIGGSVGVVGFSIRPDAPPGQPKLFACGDFSHSPGSGVVQGVAAWDGIKWLPCAGGLGGGGRAMQWQQAKNRSWQLIVCGDFSSAGGLPAGRIARWSGPSWSASSWSCLGKGFNNLARIVTLYDDGRGGGPMLYAVGAFTAIGSTAVTSVARWNGSEWQVAGAPPDGTVECMEVFNGDSGPVLVAGGDFTHIGGVEANRVAVWDGLSWAPLGSGIASGTVLALKSWPQGGPGGTPALYVGGSFTQPSTNVARWSGGSWSAVGTLSGTVRTLEIFNDGTGDALFAGGTFWASGNTPINRVAKWTSGHWQALGEGVSGTVNTMTSFTPEGASAPQLFVGGEFATAGAHFAAGIAAWDGGEWSSVGAGLTRESPTAPPVVTYLCAWQRSGGEAPLLLVAGRFAGARGESASDSRRIVAWDGVQWRGFGSGLNGTVSTYSNGSANSIALLPGNNSFLVAGSFATSPAGDAVAAVWDECAPHTGGNSDLNGDGIVDGADLGLLLGAWGLCEGCAEDLTGDGTVDGADLGVLLGAWTG